MKKFIGFIFVMLVSFYSTSFAKDIPTQNVGEQAMIEVVRAAINTKTEIREYHDKIIIGAGISGAEAFKIPPNLNELHLLLTWQWLDDFNNLANNTIVVLPDHSVNERFETLKGKGIKLITISGVVHQKTISKIKNEPVDEINPYTDYIVMLAGDTQQEKGEWIKYNRKMLQDLLEFLPQEQNILVLNGPRTGKFLENTNEPHVNAHKTETDYITLTVQEKNFETWKIMDFKYGKKSLWDTVLHFCMLYPKVGLILPGESTSMISETLSLGILPIVYTHQAYPSWEPALRLAITLILDSMGAVLLFY